MPKTCEYWYNYQYPGKNWEVRSGEWTKGPGPEQLLITKDGGAEIHCKYHAPYDNDTDINLECYLSFECGAGSSATIKLGGASILFEYDGNGTKISCNGRFHYAGGHRSGLLKVWANHLSGLINWDSQWWFFGGLGNDISYSTGSVTGGGQIVFGKPHFLKMDEECYPGGWTCGHLGVFPYAVDVSVNCWQGENAGGNGMFHLTTVPPDAIGTAWACGAFTPPEQDIIFQADECCKYAYDWKFPNLPITRHSYVGIALGGYHPYHYEGYDGWTVSLWCACLHQGVDYTGSTGVQWACGVASEHGAFEIRCCNFNGPWYNCHPPQTCGGISGDVSVNYYFSEES